MNEERELIVCEEEAVEESTVSKKEKIKTIGKKILVGGLAILGGITVVRKIFSRSGDDSDTSYADENEQETSVCDDAE